MLLVRGDRRVCAVVVAHRDLVVVLLPLVIVVQGSIPVRVAVGTRVGRVHAGVAGL